MRPELNFGLMTSEEIRGFIESQIRDIELHFKNVCCGLAELRSRGEDHPLMRHDLFRKFEKVAVGTITPKAIKAHVAQTSDVSKIYDGTSAASKDNLVIDDGILSEDAGVVKLDWTADYDNKNASSDPKVANTSLTSCSHCAKSPALLW